MPKLSRAQRDIITEAARDGGLIVTPAHDARVVEQTVWHKLVESTEQSDGSFLLVATEAGKAAIAAADKPAARKPDEPAAEASAPPPATPPSDPKGKLGAMLLLLRRPTGASVEDLVAATGWQAHSVRGAMSGALKKKLGVEITSEKVDGRRIYRISATEA